MNPQEIFCPNIACPARGQTGKGNIHVHSQKDERFICDACRETFTIRLWLGGVVSRKRDLDLIQSLVDNVRAIALCRPLLLAADGLASYVAAFRMAFRSKMPHLAPSAFIGCSVHPLLPPN
ncbi:MAG: hypothetical protein RBS68_15995 [Anaerolineales bacterium]|jgi:transposase-like protein|nr:hypothetical protein [Anaerolineales bacterium]